MFSNMAASEENSGCVSIVFFQNKFEFMNLFKLVEVVFVFPEQMVLSKPEIGQMSVP